LARYADVTVEAGEGRADAACGAKRSCMHVDQRDSIDCCIVSFL
jgi:hypothetical protein